MRNIGLYTLLFAFVVYGSCKGQNAIYGSNAIVRNIAQDRKGDIWIASFEGVFRYEGKSFTNVTSGVSTGRFFSVLEDRKGNMWFGSIGSGVYQYDGKSFKNFTTKDGLLNNEISWIYEDRSGNIWFGANGGASVYNGKSFRNFFINDDTMVEDRTGKTFPDFTRPPMEITSIVEDKAGKLLLATRGHTFIYDGIMFTTFTREGKSFTNVRTMVKDKKGNIWLGGNDGLWRYDGDTFINFTRNFVGYIYEDKKGNIWTSSGSTTGQNNWALSRYNETSLSGKNATAPEIIKEGEGMIFGIVEASDNSIWFGTGNGVNRYDGKSFNNFKR